MPRLVLALVATIALGLFSRLYPIGWPPYDKSLGDVLYAVAAYLALALVFFRRSLALVAALALVACEAIEFFQATGIPEHLARQWRPFGWLLGTTFAWHDVACYVVGVVFVMVFDVTLLRPAPVRQRCPSAVGPLQ